MVHPLLILPNFAVISVTAYCRDHEITPEECVQALRDEVREKTKLTVSAGIAPNKVFLREPDLNTV